MNNASNLAVMEYDPPTKDQPADESFAPLVDSISPSVLIERVLTRARSDTLAQFDRHDVHVELARRIESARESGVTALLNSESGRDLCIEWLTLALCGQRTIESFDATDEDDLVYCGGEALMDLDSDCSPDTRKASLEAVYASLNALPPTGSTIGRRAAISQRLRLSWDGFVRLAAVGEGELSGSDRASVIESAKVQHALANEFVTLNLRLVRCADGVKWAPLDAMEDVFQEGALGLMRAVQLWDYRKGFQFSTFADQWIRQAVARELNTHGRVITPRVNSVPAWNRAERVRVRLAQQLGREPNDAEVAAAVGSDVSELRYIMSECASAVSLERPRSESGGTSLEDAVGTEDECFDVLERESTVNLVNDACGALTPMERKILNLRYGLDGNEPVSNELLAEMLGLRRETARIHTKRALAKLRDGIYGTQLAEELNKVTD